MPARSTLLALLLATLPAALVAGGAVEGDVTVLEAGGGDGESLPDRLAARLDPFVLTGLVSDRLRLEVDWIEGCRPSERALAAAAALLREHAAPGREIEVVADDEIARAEWSADFVGARLEGSIARHLDADPSDWEQVEVVYVLYVPDGGTRFEAGLSGATELVTFERAGRVVSVRVVLLFLDEIRRDAMLWVTAAKVEQAALAHELGHVLGLVANPQHEQAGAAGHCSAARCVMHRPGARALWVNGLPALFAGHIPHDFCRRCTRDIATAERVWAERAARSSEFVRSLRAARLLRDTQRAAAWHASHDPP